MLLCLNCYDHVIKREAAKHIKDKNFLDWGRESAPNGLEKALLYAKVLEKNECR